MQRTYYFHNHTHVGDNLISLDFLNKLSRLNNIKCVISVDFTYLGNSIDELNEFIPLNKNVLIADHRDPSSINLWYPFVARRVLKNDPDNWNLINYDIIQNIFGIWFEIGNFISSELNLQSPFSKIRDVIFDGELFSIPSKINKEYDVLLVNSYSRSSQMYFSDIEHDNY
jgi:hypothetical protein